MIKELPPAVQEIVDIAYTSALMSTHIIADWPDEFAEGFLSSQRAHVFRLAALASGSIEIAMDAEEAYVNKVAAAGQAAAHSNS